MQNLRLKLIVAGMAALLAALAWAVLAQLDVFKEHRTWRIATGHPDGSYFKLGSELASVLSADFAPYERFEVDETAGSAENIGRIARGEAAFAFVQSDADPVANARLVALLYQEIVHIVVRADHHAAGLAVDDLGTLAAVSLGAEGSGTRMVAERLLDHFDVALAGAPLDVDPSELRARFESGQLDAAFLLVGPGSALAEDLLTSPDVRLLSLGAGPEGGTAADAFAVLNPAFRAQLLPARLYGPQPVEPVRTVGVNAMLVASDDVDDDLVREVTASLFRNANRLSAGMDTPLTLTHSPDADRLVLPLHEGALGYYLREQPFFLVEYAEVISLGLTLLVGLWSLGTLLLRWTAGMKKERIDRYYSDIRASSSLPSEERLGRLRQIHGNAFEELMAERLAANESFVIFHDYLLSEIGRAERDTAAPAE
ncbi:MAG: TAXI family TRAP transporter solute-binding subunit [Planctomycetota bacterium]